MSVRFLFRDLGLNRLRNVWTRHVNVGSVVKKYRRDRSVREVFLCFRQAFFRPRGTLLLSATAACQAKDQNDEDVSELPQCAKDVTDEELEEMLSAFDGIQALSETIFCPTCNKRVVIDRRHSGIKYCTCKEPSLPTISKDGWEPYVEADDTIIWRKEYKVGQGLYAYKVYGRYNDVQASHYAAVNVDTAFRKEWDAAVADLSIVEHSSSVPDQAIIHWEVLWPRLFANRDYVYIRRHKEYNIDTLHHNPFEERTPEALDVAPTAVANPASIPAKDTENGQNRCSDGECGDERSSVHSNAKRKSLEMYSRMPKETSPEYRSNKVYVILSRSCTHPEVPEAKNAIRVTEYWSRMVVRSTDGAEQSGMEFVLTYYDEPAVGGLPSGVASWASGRAAPAYLDKMREAAKRYEAYRRENGADDLSDEDTATQARPDTISYKEPAPKPINELDMESSKQGPELENGLNGNEEQSREEESPSEEHDAEESQTESRTEEGEQKGTEERKNEGTQTDLYHSVIKVETPDGTDDNVTKSAQTEAAKDSEPTEAKTEEEEEPKSRWRYSFYFFS